MPGLAAWPRELEGVDLRAGGALVAHKFLAGVEAGGDARVGEVDVDLGTKGSRFRLKKMRQVTRKRKGVGGEIGDKHDGREWSFSPATMAALRGGV